MATENVLLFITYYNIKFPNRVPEKKMNHNQFQRPLQTALCLYKI